LKKKSEVQEARPIGASLEQRKSKGAVKGKRNRGEGHALFGKDPQLKDQKEKKEIGGNSSRTREGAGRMSKEKTLYGALMRGAHGSKKREVSNHLRTSEKGGGGGGGGGGAKKMVRFSCARGKSARANNRRWKEKHLVDLADTRKKGGQFPAAVLAGKRKE